MNDAAVTPVKCDRFFEFCSSSVVVWERVKSLKKSRLSLNLLRDWVDKAYDLEGSKRIK